MILSYLSNICTSTNSSVLETSNHKVAGSNKNNKTMLNVKDYQNQAEVTSLNPNIINIFYF